VSWRVVTALATAVVFALVPVPAAAQAPAQVLAPEPVHAARGPVEEAAELARQAQQLSKEYQAAKEQLAQRRTEAAAASAESDKATATASAARARQGDFYGQVDKLTAASFRGARFNQLAALLVSTSPQEFLDQMSALDLIAADNKKALDALKAVVDETEGAERAATEASDRAKQAEQQAAQLEADLARRLEELQARQLELTGRLDQLSAVDRDTLSGYANGRIPASALCRANGDGPLLQCGAARAYEAMDAAFAAVNGRRLCAGGGYRSYEEQVRLYAQKPGLAAKPGTSNHGWGLAVDLCSPGGGNLQFGSSDYRWLAANGSAFGWVNPPWARPGGGREEPWHWEYTG
jgi:predicted  nucleic acid-binding Zn-ribbon protein